MGYAPADWARYEYVFRLADKNGQETSGDSVANIKAQCEKSYQIPELDPIRHKIEFFRESPDAAPSFETASNDTFPTVEECPAIAKWANLREECVKRMDKANHISPMATPLQSTILQEDEAFKREATARVADLIVSLYQRKMTYGEFAKKRYEIGRDAAAAERSFRESVLIADQNQRIQAQQVAQQQFQNNLTAWSNYLQAVNARQPQTVHLDGTIRVR